jgi:4a-hydroxytetrahydrobiopterin dehydratase
MTKFTATQIRTAMQDVPQWRRRGQEIRREFEFDDFVAAMRFVNAVARAAEQAGHHPDIDVRWNRVRLAMSTHDAGGLTQKDFDLAVRCDRLAV